MTDAAALGRALDEHGITRVVHLAALQVPFCRADPAAGAHVASIGIRPYVVYGPGRDQGLTSGPSLAMAAAARGDGFEIGYASTVQYDFAPDVGLAFARAAAATEGAHVANFPGVPAATEDVAAAIEAAVPEVAGRITWTDDRLPFPDTLEATRLEHLVGPLPRTPLAEGVRRTIEHFRRSSAGAA